MISRELFDLIKKNNGEFASWAVWEYEGKKPKSNMGPNRIFNLEENPSLLNTLQTNVVMVGLNFSRELRNPNPFANFHDESPYANDFKIRYAFKNTVYYGAYMTDVLKYLVIPNAQKVRDYLRLYPEESCLHVQKFENELDFIQSNKPLIIAFGRDTFGLLKMYLNNNLYSNLIQITHYSHQINKESYRKEVSEQIKIGLLKN
jgi:hypothetical protein